MRRTAILWLIALWCVCSRTAIAQSSGAGVDLRALQKEATAIFNPDAITGPAAELSVIADRVLLIFQALSVTIVVAGMIAKIRRDHEQMEGIAAMMLKVAFIATIPFWRTQVLTAADSVSEAIGYRAVGAATTSSPLMTKWWDLAGQWMPPSTPQLDALESQGATNIPGSGQEEVWSLRAWNWARGVGAASTDAFNASWQTISGGIRAGFLLVCSALTTCAVLSVIMVMHLSEVFRYVLFATGCAMLPVFIAGLGVDALRQQSIKFVLGLLSIALWPIAWAVVNVCTVPLLDGAVAWMSGVASTALAKTVGNGVTPSVAVAMPFLAWGIIFVFVVLTLALCLGCGGGIVAGPWIMTKAITTGANVVRGMASVSPASGGASIAVSVAPVGGAILTTNAAEAQRSPREPTPLLVPASTPPTYFITRPSPTRRADTVVAHNSEIAHWLPLPRRSPPPPPSTGA